jgi:hypothetical protein
MRDPREENPDELDAMIAAGAFADDDIAFSREYGEWLDAQSDELYQEYRMRKVAEQFGEEF